MITNLYKAAVGIAVLIFLSGVLVRSETAGTYAVMKLNGMVSPIMADYLEESISKAQSDGARFIVIQMDTPGGFMDPMRRIIQSILSSKIPVVVYTFPSGAQAASAGGFIMLSAHVAVMSPGSEIGAMHPMAPMLDYMKRDDKGGPAGVMEKKLLNDTVAYARSLAQKRNRNEKWAERAVREAVSVTYKEAVQERVVDFVADDMDGLIAKLDNRQVMIGDSAVRLVTRGLVPVAYEMEWHQKMLNYFTDPKLLLLLLVLAVAGIGIEFKNPGMIFPGVVGSLCLLMFLLTVRIIPINIAGIAFIACAVVLFILELKFTSYGLLTVAGIASFVFGAMILFPSELQGSSIPLTAILVTLCVVLAFVFLVLRAVLSAQRGKVTTGMDGMMGETGEAVKNFDGTGKVQVHGEIWNAFSEDEIAEKDKVIVTGADGMTLLVKKYKGINKQQQFTEKQ